MATFKIGKDIAWFQQDVYVGSTSGIEKDSGSKKLATEEYVDEHISYVGKPDGYTVITVNDEDGNPVPDVAISGLVSESGAAVTTDVNGKAAVMCLASTEVTFSSEYIDLMDLTQTIQPNATDVNLVTVVMPFVESETIKFFNTSGTLKVQKTRTVDLCLVGGGAGGASGKDNQSGGYGGTGGISGKIFTVDNATLTKGNSVLAIGAGGIANQNGGDTTFLSYTSASGDSANLPFDINGLGNNVGGDGGHGGTVNGSDRTNGVRGGGNGGNSGAEGADTAQFRVNPTGANGTDGVNGGGGGGGGGGGYRINASGTVYYGNGGSGGQGGSGCLMVKIL